jgi:hypothetical protein
MNKPSSTGFAFMIVGIFLFPEMNSQEVHFRKHIIDTAFVAEGAATGDVNHDGKIDILSGAFWYEAPLWKKHRIHADTANPVKGYSTSFLNFTLDVDNDGWVDLLRFDQPGATFTWYRNPGRVNDVLWKSFLVLPKAGIESPAFEDVDGDGRKDMICNDVQTKEVLWLQAPVKKGDTRWKRHVISRHPERATHQYTHGLGWGDINGDGLNDVIIRSGWWESPKDVYREDWTFHAADLGEDCANMFVIDADADGDADVVSSSAHKYGIWWHEQTSGGWKTHEISRIFSQSHAMSCTDINGDGYPDLTSGKRYLAHLQGDPGTDDPSVLYWYEFLPGKPPQWIPHLIDDQSGIGNNFQVEDISGDGKPDIIVSNKNGVFYFEQLHE